MFYFTVLLHDVDCDCVATFLLLFLHCLVDVIKHLGHHRSKLIQHALAKVKEGVQHLLQPHTLQEARVSAGVVGIGGALLRQDVGVVQEGFLEGFVEPGAYPGDQGDAALHQRANLADEAVEGILDARNLGVRAVGALVHQDVPCLDGSLPGAKAPGHSAEQVLHLQHEKWWRLWLLSKRSQDHSKYNRI